MGLPVGLLFTGKAWSELKLLQLAADFERRTGARVPPQFQSSVSW
jgi:amidase